MPILLSLFVAAAIALAVTQVTIAVTTVYLHRALSHRALTVSPVAAFPMRSLLWLTTGMRAREWVAVHRKHHAATDTEDDPHSPIVHGFWRVQLGNVGLYRKVASDPASVRRYARDLQPDRVDRLLFDHAFLGLGVGVTLLVVTLWAFGFPLWVGFLAAIVHAFAYVMLSASINAVGHQYGTRPYENSATNSRALALVTAGEGLHNNHHAAPTSARFALHRGEVDPGWLLIRTLVTLRLAHVRHDDVKLKPAA